MKPVPDAVVTLTLLQTWEGGRSGPMPARWYGCVLQVGDASFDARLRLDTEFALGTTRTVGVDFLSPKTALMTLSAGVEFRLWDGRAIGSGRVLQVATVGASRVA